MARRQLGVVPQELVFDPFFTVRETLKIQSGYFGIPDNGPWIEEVLHNLDLDSKADSNMRSLSGGMKRRVLVAQALVHRPPVIVLDEPTAGVDVELRRSLWSFIRRLNRDGHTIVLTTHYLEEAETLCGRIAMLKAGRIIALDSASNMVRALKNIVLRIRIDRPLPAELLRPDILEEGGKYHIPLRDYRELEKVLVTLRTNGCGLLEMELDQPDLEDVFLDLMNRSG